MLFCESTMSLEQDLTVLFIEMVRSRPCLYDLANPHYKDTAVIKKNNWLDVAREWKELCGECLDGKQQIDCC